MMKFEKGKESFEIDSLESGEITFYEESISLLVEVANISVALKERVIADIELEKAIYTNRWKKHYPKMQYNNKWGNNGVVIVYHMLHVLLRANKPVKYSINTYFHDVDNYLVESISETVMDLSEYNEKIKELVIRETIDRYF